MYIHNIFICKYLLHMLYIVMYFIILYIAILFVIYLLYIYIYIYIYITGIFTQKAKVIEDHRESNIE